MHIQNFINIHPFVLKILRKNTFLHQSRAMNLLFIYKFGPFAIPNHTSLISMSMQSLKKIGQKLLKLRVRKFSNDGRTLKRFGGYNIIPRHFLVVWYKNCYKYEQKRIFFKNDPKQFLGWGKIMGWSINSKPKYF